jgi:hypothetical protein
MFQRIPCFTAIRVKTDPKEQKCGRYRGVEAVFLLPAVRRVASIP